MYVGMLIPLLPFFPLSLIMSLKS